VSVPPQLQGVGVAQSEQTWIARLTPLAGSSVAALLGMPLGLDVWERHAGFLVVAAPESRLSELERRRLAKVDRWATQKQYEAQMANRPMSGDESPRLPPIQP
jgi:hypothetical protein